jgi:hypothetical protein
LAEGGQGGFEGAEQVSYDVHTRLHLEDELNLLCDVLQANFYKIYLSQILGCWVVEVIADPEEEVGRNGDGCVRGRSSLEACCCVDEGVLSAYLDTVVEFPFAAAICKERLNCYVSSSIPPLILLYPCLCDFSALFISYMIKARDVTLSVVYGVFRYDFSCQRSLALLLCKASFTGIRRHDSQSPPSFVFL